MVVNSKYKTLETKPIRIAVFASYSDDGFLPPQVLPYLAGLKPLTSAVVVVCDNDLLPGEREKLTPFAAHVITGRHGEYDFGSYKRGIAWAKENGLLADADDLILCNDSCFGPVGSFAPMFANMEARALDFWGATDSHQISYHLQSYWVVLSHKVFSSEAFNNFIMGVQEQENVQEVILNYEVGMTKTLTAAGFTVGAVVENTLKGVHPNDPTYNNITTFPLLTLEKGVPLVKVKALRVAHTNSDGQNRLLAWLRENAPDFYNLVTSDINIKRFEDADNVAFSIIMPTYNRAWCVAKAISAVMSQYHRNFELIIVDDGSVDDTEALIAREFPDDCAEGRIRYVRLKENLGVSNARNIGVSHARNPWIAYADSDNSVRPFFLTMMANAIISNMDIDALYSRIIQVEMGRVLGADFNRGALINANSIDLGVFVHRKSLVARFGGFDADLHRLVDWDLIIRYTGHKRPYFIRQVCLDYTDDKSMGDRISVNEDFVNAQVAIHRKHHSRPTVSTVIISYNHQEYIVEAIESALAQTGNFTHEILISDDGSNDGTTRIIKWYAENYSYRIRDVSRGGNFGVSDNYLHCFREARGQYIAILEGDDYWVDSEKNLKQVEFLRAHPKAAMVFSKISLLDMKNGQSRLLKRQKGLNKLLSGKDFSEDENLNLIVNLSSSMYLNRIVNNLIPSNLYEPRMSEISLAFYFDSIGKRIGFIDEVMSVYRLNSTSVWNGASKISKLEQGIAIRETVLRAARPEYRASIRKSIEEKTRLLDYLKKDSPKENIA